jgi:hypothetical protein
VCGPVESQPTFRSCLLFASCWILVVCTLDSTGLYFRRWNSLNFNFDRWKSNVTSIPDETLKLKNWKSNVTRTSHMKLIITYISNIFSSHIALYRLTALVDEVSLNYSLTNQTRVDKRTFKIRYLKCWTVLISESVFLCWWRHRLSSHRGVGPGVPRAR